MEEILLSASSAQKYNKINQFEFWHKAKAIKSKVH